MALILDGNNTPTLGGVGYGDGTELAFTGAGTSSQVLTSSGAGAPTWATPSLGGMVFLSSVTASNSATVSLETTFSSTYDAYCIVCSGATASVDGTYLSAQLKVGGSYQTTNYKGVVGSTTSINNTQTINSMQTSTQIPLAFSIGSAAGEHVNFVAYVSNPASTSLFKMIRAISWNITDSGDSRQGDAVGHYSGSTAALTGVQFLMLTGNIVSGTFRLYGISNS